MLEFNMEIMLFLLGMFLGLLTSYSNTVASRGGIEHTNVIVIFIGFFSMLAIPAIVIWGFFNFSWWVPTLSFVGLSVLVGVFVNQKTWLFFYKISPFVGLVTIAIASYLWLQ